MPVYDTTFKELAKTGLAELLRFLLPGLNFAELVELPQELPSTLRATDLLVRVTGHPKGPRLGMVECQVGHDSRLPSLLHLRSALAGHAYDQPVQVVVLALTAAAVPPGSHHFGFYDEEEQRHRFTIRRLYEEPAEPALLQAQTAVLPLCAVMEPGDGDRAALLERILLRLAAADLSKDRRTFLLQAATNFAALYLPKTQVTLITEDLVRRHKLMLQPLRDFPFVRDAYDNGRTDGKAEGLATGLVNNLFDILELRGFDVSPEVQALIRDCLDPDVLDRWRQRAKKAASLDEIFG